MKKACLYCVGQVKKNKKFVLYNIIGGIAALIDLATVYVLTSVVGIYYILSAIISYPFATFIHFALNKHFNFKNKDKKWMQQFLCFVTINLFSLAMTIIIMYLLVEYTPLEIIFGDKEYLVAKATAMVIVVFFSFNMHKWITFREK